jgi:D-beta-D-heptose 7-phosphate kinase/D-beta-D-heptose 1-phosphate adenosyltransferase
MRTLKHLSKIPLNIAATSGCFDIIHAGHVYLFEWMRNAVGPKGQVVVLLNDDDYLLRAKGRVIVPLEQRMAVLLAMRNVDMVVPFEDDDPALLVSRLEPNFWFKGPEYKGLDFPERSVVRAHGGQLVFVEYGPKVHTSDIIREIKKVKKI